ncbi:paraslipin [Cetobacterium sp. 2A]|uniref:SPFH domain-containing protein n=2 Tax=Cetobacterium TaxID=180162 RepID=UPI00163C4BD4|nr:stomatin-like protein [Cetobacterium sp. 2A]MBC2854985.1 paraslipin [Cetobacterium sp. 2A]
MLIFGLLLIIIVLICLNVRIVSQSQAYVIERLGAFKATWGVGINVLIPFVDRIAKKVSLKEQIFDFPPQPVITKDNVTMQIDTVVYFQIVDPKLYAYGIEYPTSAIENLTATTLRNIIGEMELDATLTSRDVINTKMRAVLDEATDPWGIKINRVELKNILPPKEIQIAMERQMKAERERREAILIAEGQKRSAILVAEGQKESEILRAEAEKLATILRADGQKEATIKGAEAESEAIVALQRAKAEGIKALNEAMITKEVLTLKGMETFEKVADGQSTKLIIPSEIQNLVNFSSIFKETK